MHLPSNMADSNGCVVYIKGSRCGSEVSYTMDTCRVNERDWKQAWAEVRFYM